jgi:hypothetical protein
MKHLKTSLASLILCLALGAQTSQGFGRFVIINGHLLGMYELATLDSAAGTLVPDGRYWINLQTGEWGYEGGPRQGVIGGEDRASFEAKVRDLCARNPEVGC